MILSLWRIPVLSPLHLCAPFPVCHVNTNCHTNCMSMTVSGKRCRSHALNYEHATALPSKTVFCNRRWIPDVECCFCSSVKWFCLRGICGCLKYLVSVMYLCCLICFRSVKCFCLRIRTASFVSVIFHSKAFLIFLFCFWGVRAIISKRELCKQRIFYI